MGIFPEFFENLKNHYGQGFLQNPIATLDSGFCSLKNADIIDGSGWSYLFALKGIQSGLFQEAQRLFSSLTLLEPEYITAWESYQGKLIRFKLYRSCEMAARETDAGVWNHLRQVWLIVTEERNQNYLTPEQILRIIRDN